MTDWLLIDEVEQPCPECGDDPMTPPCWRCRARQEREEAEAWGAECRESWDD